MLDSILSLASALVLAILVSTSLAVSVFGPLTAITNRHARSPRILISDLLVLAIHLQVAVGTIHLLLGRWSTWRQLAFSLFVCILLVAWWCNGVRMARQWQAGGAWRRFWFLAVLAPLGHFAALTTAMLPFCLIAIILLAFAGFMFHSPDALTAILPTLFLVAGQLILLFSCRDACRRLASQIASPSKTSSPA